MAAGLVCARPRRWVSGCAESAVPTVQPVGVTKGGLLVLLLISAHHASDDLRVGVGALLLGARGPGDNVDIATAGSCQS